MRSLLLKLAVAASLALALACGGGKKDSTIAVTGVSLPEKIYINQGGTGTLAATLAPADATNKEVAWASGDTAKVTVPANATGLSVTVTGVGLGTAPVTVTTKDGNKTDTCNVTVVPPGAVTGVSLPPTLAVVVGTPGTLTATVSPLEATNKAVTWASSDTTKATVTGTGLTVTINGIAAGTTTITVTTADGGHHAECLVTVSVPVIPVTGVGLNTTSSNLPMGSTLVLTATVSPGNATNQALNWSNSNNAAATISATTGASITVTPVAVGGTIVTVRSAADSSKVATCTITVQAANVPVQSVTLPQTLNIPTGGTAPLTAVMAPTNATNPAVTWTSSDTTKVTVTGTGLSVTLNGLAAGQSTIRCASVADPTKFGECAVTVADVAVTGVTLPQTFTVYSGWTGSLAATLAPANATNKNVTWVSGSPNVATVVGNGLTAVITPVATTGDTVITVTTAQGNFQATCTVSVQTLSGPAVFVGGDFGLLFNGAAQGGYANAIVQQVAVDANNVVHACGYDRATGTAVYWRNGAKTTLPQATGTQGEALGLCIDGTTVYICGYGWANNTATVALWTVATTGGNPARTAVPNLEGTEWSLAQGVCRLSGVTYLCGEIVRSNGYDGYAVWCLGSSPSVIAITNGTGGPALQPCIRIAGLGSRLFVADYGFGIISHDLEGAEIGQYQCGGTDVRNVNGTLYACGWEAGGDYPPQYFTSTNGTAWSATTLPEYGNANSLWAEAWGVCPGDGTVYSCGIDCFDEEYEVMSPYLWRGNQIVQYAGWSGVQVMGWARTVFVK